MADTKISALTAATVAALTNELVINEAGTSKKATIDQIKTLLQTLGMPRVARLGSQHSNSTATGTKVTGLDLTLEAGTYTFEYRLIVRSSLAATAPTFALNFSGTNGTMNWWYQYADTSATLLAAIGSISYNVSTQTLGFHMAQSENTKATTTSNMGPTGGVQTAATNIMVRINGLIVVTVQGDLQLYHASEDANATTVEVDSSLIVIRTA